METAIPRHLRRVRTQPASLPEGWQPPYPSFVARFASSVKRVGMVYLGVQYTGERPVVVSDAVAELAAACRGRDGRVQVDRAGYVDESGYTTELTVAYWDDMTAYDRWFAEARELWIGDHHATEEAGFFIEAIRPEVSRFETLFSNDRCEGIARLADELSGEVAEHAYWGGARDRLPHAQTDPLDPGDPPALIGDGLRQRVRGQDNLCLIRSGQDWTETAGEERRMYLKDVEPVLRAGMEFLRDQGRAVGCYANRYLRLLGEQGRPTDKSFGMSWWRSLADLDTWARDHPTHKAIFGQAMRYLGTLGPAARLRLHHEVTVAAADEQHFEYLGCHPATGLLRAVTPAPAPT